MDWRSLALHGKDRGSDFYATALRYGNHLWMRGYAARSILCLDRALGADLSGGEPILQDWPLPYRALAWILNETPPGVFIGNPRVHFQHYAGRMNEPRREQRRWRAWACWAIARVVLPQLPGDPRHRIDEPDRDEIDRQLQRLGHAGELELWRSVVDATD
ncbi:hypothetical protein DB347_09625 [Opitutaceae bacterium EW11]|nr:hypothetical protein DB347_09625 [Opitutaceae bacterium EW11]